MEVFVRDIGIGILNGSMGLVDFILNLAGLLLWLNWRTSSFDPLALATPATLAGTLRRAGTRRLRRWHFPTLLTGLVVLRALFYWQIGSAVHWAGTLDFGVFSLSFRSDRFGMMLLFSVLSFTGFLGIFLLWLVLLSILKRRTPNVDPIQRAIRHQLGPVDGWPRWVKMFLPLLAGVALWWLLHWPLVHWGILPPAISTAHLAEQSLIIGLCCYLPWKLLVAALLVTHLVTAYIYLGNHPLWNYISAMSQTLLTPLHPLPLRVGRVDFAPVLGLAVLFGLATLYKWGIDRLYALLPI